MFVGVPLLFPPLPLPLLLLEMLARATLVFDSFPLAPFSCFASFEKSKEKVLSYVHVTTESKLVQEDRKRDN